MSFLNSLKTNIGNKKLRNRFEKISRKKQPLNLKQAKQIGILFYCKDENEYNQIRAFINKIKTETNTVKALAFIDSTKTPLYWLANSNYDYFTKKELSFCRIPKGESVEAFMNAQFDLVINACIENLFPLHYIVGLSNSKFRAGHDESNAKVYDFMLNTNPEKGINHFLNELYHYLNILNQ